MTTPTPRTDELKRAIWQLLQTQESEKVYAWRDAIHCGIEALERDLAAAQEELERVRDKCNEHYMALAAAREALQRAEERAQAWREKTHEAEDVALAALASFALTQSVDDYPQDHWAHRAERIRTIRAAIDAAREGK